MVESSNEPFLTRKLRLVTLAAGLIAPAFLAAGCSSSEPKSDGAPAAPVEKAPDKVEAKPQEPEQLEPITIKKGDKHSPEASYLDKPDPGNVSIDFKNVDLAKVALPLFSKQAGVIVEYAGPPKTISSLRLLNAPWRDALDYICRFTQTHAVASQVGGRIELKLGASDSKAFLEKFDPKRRDVVLSGGADEGANGGSVSGITTSNGSGSGTSSGAAPGSQAGATGTSPEPGNGEIEDPNAKGKATIERLRTGVSTNNSGQ